MGAFCAKLVRTVPALPYVSLGLWLAWIAISYGSTAWLSASESDGSNIGVMYVLSTGALAAVLLLAGGMPDRLGVRLSGSGALGWGGLLSFASCVCIVLLGPCYLKPYLNPEALKVVARAAAVVAGAGTAPIVLVCGRLYGRLVPRRAVLYAALSTLVAAATYFIVVGGPQWEPVSGGPALSGIVGFCGLPLLAALCCGLSRYGQAEASGDAARRTHAVPCAFRRFCFAVFVFGFIATAVRASVVEPSPVAQTIDGMKPVMLMRIAMAFAFVAMAAGFDAEKMNFGKLYSLVMASVVVLVACCPLTEGSLLGLSWAISFMASLLEFLLWCVLAFMVYQKSLSPLFVYGWGLGAFQLGCGLGWLAGAHAFPYLEHEAGRLVLYLVLAFIVLGCAVLLFSERDFDDLFKSEGAGTPTYDEMMTYAAGTARTDDEAGRRRFGRAVELVAEGAGLTPREADVLRCLAMGYDAGKVADTLSISWHTVRTHTTSLYAKLNVHSKREVIELIDKRVKALGE